MRRPFLSCLTADDMTNIELAREIAAGTKARIVEIAPRRRVRVGDAMRKLRAEDAERISALLETELERLVGTWGESNGSVL